MNAAAMRALADAADALARMAQAVVDATETRADPDDLLPLADAAHRAATSTRVLRDAIRARELPAYGRARDRAIRRSDLDAWIATRRVVRMDAVDDPDIERRMRRLARTKGTQEAAKVEERSTR